MAADDGIAIVVLTHNRAHLVSKCVENVLKRTSDATREIVIWDNASTDETQEYLATVDDPRIRVIRSEQNIGQSAYARAFAERYPWVRLYTPVNEMYVCARMSALDGNWNEQALPSFDSGTTRHSRIEKACWK